MVTQQRPSSVDEFMQEAYSRIRASVSTSSANKPASPLPSLKQLNKARSLLPDPQNGDYLSEKGCQDTLNHLLDDIAPALNRQNRSSRYWGFVTGATLPIAEIADNLCSAYDQNVHMHLPGQSIATEVEDAALKMLISLLDLGDASHWRGRTFTTGATGSNILGLLCGRESIIQSRLPKGAESVGDLGLLGACLQAGIREIQVLTSMGHSSLSKAASIVGIGRSSVKELPYCSEKPWRLNLDAVEKELQREGVVSIIAISAGEVNTGYFATTGLDDMKRLRQMADTYGAWIHVDGAFGIYARALPETDEFTRLRKCTDGLEFSDSITVDGHKLLNVPYDNGGESDIQSPLNIALENSRRFRALPVYAVLLSQGRAKLEGMFIRMVRLARGIAHAIQESDDYILLPRQEVKNMDDTHVIVLFRAKNDSLNEVLVDKINKTDEWYVSGTKWKGEPAVRIAVANWRINVEDDLSLVKRSLRAIAQEHSRI